LEIELFIESLDHILKEYYQISKQPNKFPEVTMKVYGKKVSIEQKAIKAHKENNKL
jgi:hypothetical protein